MSIKGNRILSKYDQDQDLEHRKLYVPSFSSYISANHECFIQDPSGNQELKQLFLQDQKERENGQIPNRKNDQNRRFRVSELMSELKSLVAEDYYHAAVIFNHGESVEDFKKANKYAKEALGLGEPRSLWLFAATYDRWLLEQTPAKPQIYGTQRRARDDKLIHPEGYPSIDRNAINMARSKLCLQSLEKEEEDLVKERTIKTSVKL